METYIDVMGKEARSVAVVYPEQELAIEGKLFLGKLSSLTNEQKANPLLVDTVEEIKSVLSTPNLKGDFMFYKVWL